jgi:hypothetical protein
VGNDRYNYLNITLYHSYYKPFRIDLMKNVLYSKIMARKPLSTRIENDLQKDIKKLAIDLEKPFNDIIEEALRDLLEKYKSKGRNNL